MKLSPVDSKYCKLSSLRIVVGSVVLILALGVACWVGMRGGSETVPLQTGADIGTKLSSKIGSGIHHSGAGGAGDLGGISNAKSGGHRPPLQIRVKPEEPSAVTAVLVTGEQNMNARVRQLQAMRGASFSAEEREAAMTFLSGKELPHGMGRGSVDWLSDELLTALRLQEPPQEDLAQRLAEVAFQPDTNPVTRDYIMQHLGHLWEQYGAQKVIEKTLWEAVGTADELAPGTALIALSRGYERDGKTQNLADVQQRAYELAKNSSAPLAVRVTALVISGEGGGKDVKEFAATLVANTETPVILKKVAEQISER
jgi:hypothetical protein